MDPLMIGGFFEFRMVMMWGAVYSHKIDGWTIPACNRGWENGCLLWRWYEFRMLMVRQTGKYICEYRTTHSNPIWGVWCLAQVFFSSKLCNVTCRIALLLMATGSTFLLRVTVNAKRSSKQVVTLPLRRHFRPCSAFRFCFVGSTCMLHLGVCVWTANDSLLIYSKFSSVPSIHPSLTMSVLSFHLPYFFHQKLS